MSHKLKMFTDFEKPDLSLFRCHPTYHLVKKFCPFITHKNLSSPCIKPNKVRIQISLDIDEINLIVRTNHIPTIK